MRRGAGTFCFEFARAVFSSSSLCLLHLIPVLWPGRIELCSLKRRGRTHKIMFTRPRQQPDNNQLDLTMVRVLDPELGELEHHAYNRRLSLVDERTKLTRKGSGNKSMPDRLFGDSGSRCSFFPPIHSNAYTDGDLPKGHLSQERDTVR